MANVLVVVAVLVYRPRGAGAAQDGRAMSPPWHMNTPLCTAVLARRQTFREGMSYINCAVSSTPFRQVVGPHALAWPSLRNGLTKLQENFGLARLEQTFTAGNRGRPAADSCNIRLGSGTQTRHGQKLPDRASGQTKPGNLN
jgi:hypothetical protein